MTEDPSKKKEKEKKWWVGHDREGHWGAVFQEYINNSAVKQTHEAGGHKQSPSNSSQRSLRVIIAIFSVLATGEEGRTQREIKKIKGRGNKVWSGGEERRTKGAARH